MDNMRSYQLMVSSINPFTFSLLDNLKIFACRTGLLAGLCVIVFIIHIIVWLIIEYPAIAGGIVVGLVISNLRYLVKQIIRLTLGLFGTVYNWFSVNLAPDMKRVKEASLQHIEAETLIKQAALFQKIAEANEAMNRLATSARSEAIAMNTRLAEIQKKKAEAHMLDADSQAILADALAIQMEAKRRLLNALEQFNKEGGEILIEDTIERLKTEGEGTPGKGIAG